MSKASRRRPAWGDKRPAGDWRRKLAVDNPVGSVWLEAKLAGFEKLGFKFSRWVKRKSISRVGCWVISSKCKLARGRKLEFVVLIESIGLQMSLNMLKAGVDECSLADGYLYLDDVTHWNDEALADWVFFGRPL